MLWEPRDFGECRDKATLGHGCDTCNEDPFDSGVPKRRFVRKSSIKDLISAFFSAFCVYNVNGEFAKWRGFTRKQDNVQWTFPDAFYAQGGPPKTAKSAKLWSIWPCASSRKAFLLPSCPKRCVTTRDFPYISLYGVPIIFAKIHVQLIHQCHPVVKGPPHLSNHFCSPQGGQKIQILL